MKCLVVVAIFLLALTNHAHGSSSECQKNLEDGAKMFVDMCNRGEIPAGASPFDDGRATGFLDAQGQQNMNDCVEIGKGSDCNRFTEAAKCFLNKGICNHIGDIDAPSKS
uniref:Putative conserved secreted protein n=2 Tax=Nyssomyia neivai TaxID=330878 RepID=A0A1L8DPC2_9DIPT